MLKLTREIKTKSERDGAPEKEDLMRHFKRDLGMMLTGLALGAVLTGGAVAAGVMAEPSWSPIYVDGQQVQMTAYNIAGNNYVKLRDIGQAVGFNVYYQNGVQVDSDAPYTGEAPIQSKAPTSSSLQVSSYKGNTLSVEERSMVVVSPYGTSVTTVSSNPVVIALERSLGHWVMAAKAPGSATVSITDDAGNTAGMSMTVSGGESAPVQPDTGTLPAAEPAKDQKDTSAVVNREWSHNPEANLQANMEIRLEMVRLINQVRREHGVAELPIDERLMNATQDVSTQHFNKHTQYEREALIAYGWLHGGSNNLTCFNMASYGNISQRTVTNWVNSLGNLQSMLRDDVTCLGVGVTIADDMAYCHMCVGDPTGHGIL